MSKLMPYAPLRLLAFIPAALAFAANAASGAGDGDAALRRVVQRLKAGEATRIVCFGDSITGRYYHTGSRLAYPDLVEQGLRKPYPKTEAVVINAGISGNTTSAGLKRMERDVLRHKPDLVVVMYGMNDVCGYNPKAFAANLRTIIKRCRDAGAAVMLCTQNNTYPAGPRRPPERLAHYTQIIRDVGKETRTPVADCRAEFEAIQKRDRRAWVMLMSETIHPNLNGHRVFAQTIIETLTGERLPLDAFAGSRPLIPRTLSAAKQGTIKVTAAGLDAATVEAAMKMALPSAQVKATTRPFDGATIDALAKQSSKLFKAHAEHLLLIALPAEPLSQDFEAYKRRVFNVVRWSVRFGYHPHALDVVWVLPSVLTNEPSPALRKREEEMAALARSHDIGAIARPAGNTQPAAEVIAAWLRGEATTTARR